MEVRCEGRKEGGRAIRGRDRRMRLRREGREGGRVREREGG